MMDKERLEQIKNNNPKNMVIISEVVKAIGNIPNEEINSYLLELESELNTISSEDLVNKTIKRFISYRNQEIEVNHELPKIIEQVLNSEETKVILTDILSNTETLGEHNLIAIDGTPLAANMERTRTVVGFITNYIVIHQEAYDMDNLYNKLKSSDINSMTTTELNNFFSRIIATSVEKKLSVSANTIEGKKQVVKYVYHNFIENGYCYQGTNAKFRKDIEERGLSTEFSKTTDENLIVVDEIFKRHGLDKIFFSKLSETKVAPYYYTTDSMSAAYHFSYHNPEYFAYFVASGNYMPNEKYDRTAYYLRDRSSCQQNIEKLCTHYHLSPEEKAVVLNTFNQLADDFMTENANSVTFVSRKLINKDKLSVNFSDINSRSIESIIEEITKNREGSSGTKQNISISADKIDVISVPSLSSFYDKEKVSSADKRKYIPLNTGEKYYYDILIHADNIDYDCISILDGEPTLQTKTSRDSRHKGEGTIDIITCSKDIGPDTLLSNGNSSFQSLQMMIAVNGKANSKLGEELISESRKNYSPKYMSDYYYHLCDMCCAIATDESQNDMTRCQAILRMAKDFYPKAELMRKTDDYPEFIDEDKHLQEYLSYPERIQVKEVESIKKRIDKNVDNKILNSCGEMFREKLSGKLNPEFNSEFNKKAEQYGINNFIEKYQRQDNSHKSIESKNKSSQSSRNELQSMFENTPQPNSQSSTISLSESSSHSQLTSNGPKVMKKTSSSNQSPASTNNGGLSTSIGLIMITISAIIIILSIIIFR